MTLDELKPGESGRITTIGVPFPVGAKESQRTFIMTFNLKAKKAFG